MITAGKVESDFYSLLKGSSLLKGLKAGSKIYYEGMRPCSQKSEDVVIIFSSGLSKQISSGYVKLNIYYDLLDNGQGLLVRDKSRGDEIEQLACEWIKSIHISGNYRISLSSTIQSFVDYDIKQSYVAVRLFYEYFE